MEIILELRELSLATTRSIVCYALARMLEGTAAAWGFQGEGDGTIRVPLCFFDNFMNRHQSRLKFQATATTEGRSISASGTPRGSGLTLGRCSTSRIMS